MGHIGRIVSKLARYPDAVDILISSLSKVLRAPEDDRFRRIPMDNKHFRENVLNAAGGVELLHAVGYIDQGPYMVLRKVDVKRISHAKSSLERARDHSTQYEDAKEAQQLAHALKQSKDDALQQDIRRKSALLAKVPKEPPEGAAGSVGLCFHLNDNGVDRKVRRRFESHDTLQDLYNYVGSLQQLKSQNWELVNITMSPPDVLAPDRNRATLQKLDLWPVGHVLIKAY